MKQTLIKPKWDEATTPLRHTWEGVVNIDQFRWMVRRDVQEQLKMAHDELGARHVRAVGMFDDEMRVLGKDPKHFNVAGGGEARVNWQVVDYVIDSLLDIGISPMFTTSFVPGEYASGTATVFTTKGRVSPPKDYKQWRDLVSGGVRHMIDRYGLDIVGGWYFEVWNEPNLQGSFFDGTQQDFWKLWSETYRAIKEVDATLRVGGPSTARAEWVQDLIEFGRKNDCEPDYLITHVYNNDSTSGAVAPFDGPPEHSAPGSPHYATGAIRGVRRVLDELNFGGEVHWNEWGRSWWPHFPDRESANEAAFVAKTMSEVSQLADYFAYWCLSDVYDQMGYGATTFHGNYGLLNLQGLRKPPYHAFQLLSKLGNERINTVVENGSDCHGAIVTRRDDRCAALVYSYEAASEYSVREQTVEVELPAGVNWNTQNLTLHGISGNENNILSHWQRMGAPDYLRREELRELQSQNALQPSVTAVELLSHGGVQKARFSMEMPGVALLQCARANA
jgi:xylan 1,4-beta-xylosidase